MIFRRTCAFVLLIALVAVGLAAPAAQAAGTVDATIEVSLPANTLDEAVSAIENALAADGYTVQQTFGVSSGLAGRGVDFPPYTLVVVAADRAIEEAVAESPTLAALLPPTIYVYEAHGGEMRAGMLRTEHLLTVFGVAEEAARAVTDTLTGLHGILLAVGTRVNDVPQGDIPEEKPYLMATFAGFPLADAVILLEVGLQGKNLNIPGKATVGQVEQFYACSLGYGRVLFSDEPGLGGLAPCRVFLYQDGEDVVMGTLELKALHSLFPGLADETLDVMQEATEQVRQAFVEMGAQL